MDSKPLNNAQNSVPRRPSERIHSLKIYCRLEPTHPFFYHLKIKPMLKSHIIYEDIVDCRSIKCSCGNPDCRIGVSFDSDPNIMRLQDKYGNEHMMHLSKENAKQLIQALKGYAR